MLERTHVAGRPGPVDPLDWHISKAEAGAYLDGVTARLRKAGLQAENTLLEGQASERIIEFARGHDVNLIILSSHGRSGLSGWNVSSVVQKVVLRAYTPTMIVRAYQPVTHDVTGLRYRRLLESLNLSAARRRKIGSAVAQIEQLIYYASIYSPYTHLDCRFLDDRLRALADSLHPDDRREFPFTAEAIDWSDYLVNRHIPGLRKFVLGAKEATKRLMPMVSDAVPDDREFRRSLHQAKTIFDAFQRSVSLCGNKVALQIKRAGKWVRYTYNEALAATAAIAKRFAEHGLVAGDRVVICGFFTGLQAHCFW